MKKKKELHKENFLNIKIEVPEKIGKSCKNALSIEAENNKMPRSNVLVKYNKNFLEIKITAKDLSALRAAMNTYLRWTIMCLKLINY